MKYLSIILFIFINLSSTSAKELNFYLESAYKKNPKLNAERKKLKSTEENINISRSEFLPSVSISSDIDSTNSTNRTNQSGNSLSDISTSKETKKISVDQKIFNGFEDFNSLKKSKLEVKKAQMELKLLEQQVIHDAAFAYYDLIYKIKSQKSNLENVDLFERQVESDSARMQKGEITLSDLAQSESSLAGARADFITSKTELLTARKNFERITRQKTPENINQSKNIKLILPTSLSEALKIAEDNNPQLLIAKIDYEISKKNLQIEKAQLSPSASVNYSKSEISDFSSAVDDVEQESVKATLTWPILKGGKNYSSIKKSKFKKEQSSLILEDKVNEVMTDTSNDWSVYQSTRSVLKATLAQVSAAEIANEGISLEYDAGNKRTTLDVIQSRSFLLNAKISNARAERDFIISKFNLLSQLGKLTLTNIKNF